MRLVMHLLRAMLTGGTVILLVLAARTYEPPAVAPLADMSVAVSARPRLTEHCQGGGGSTYSPPTCYWTLRLDDGKRLSWPWPDPGGGVKRSDAYLRNNGPITVRFWRGTVYEIVMNDGHAWLSYGDAAGAQRTRQWFWIVTGVVVVAASTVRIGVELRGLTSVPTVRMHAAAILRLDAVSVGGAVLLAGAGGDRIWWPVMAMGALAGVADVATRILPSKARWICEPVHPSDP